MLITGKSQNRDIKLYPFKDLKSNQMSQLTLFLTRIVLVSDQREIEPAKSKNLIECMLYYEYKLKDIQGGNAYTLNETII